MGATRNRRVSPPSRRYIDDSLLVVMNPRRIPACLEAFQSAPLDVAYVQGMREAEALLTINRIIRASRYDRFLIVSDDVIVTDTAIRAVVAASKLNDHWIVTGFCNLDADSPLVNITRRPLDGDTPHPAAYDFYRRDELPQHGTIRTGFAGLALTCIPQALVGHVLPLGWYGQGWASDFHLSKRLEQAGIQIVAPAQAFVWHVKERWNEPDADPAKRLFITKRGEVAWQRHGLPFMPSPSAPLSSNVNGGTIMGEPKIAEKDITRVNDLGQNVVLVPKGQPIPEDLDLTGSTADTKAREPVEDKAARPAASKRGKK